MLLRNKNLECTVPRRSSINGRVNCTPTVAPPVETLRVTSVPRNVSTAPSFEQDEQPRFKLMVFRMPETLKTDFKMALLKNHVDVQHTFEAFSEIFIAWAAGEKIPDPMKAIIRRTITLMNGV